MWWFILRRALESLKGRRIPNDSSIKISSHRLNFFSPSWTKREDLTSHWGSAATQGLTEDDYSALTPEYWLHGRRETEFKRWREERKHSSCVNLLDLTFLMVCYSDMSKIVFETVLISRKVRLVTEKWCANRWLWSPHQTLHPTSCRAATSSPLPSGQWRVRTCFTSPWNSPTASGCWLSFGCKQETPTMRWVLCVD